MEMYLETIYLMESQGGQARVADIARALKVSKPSVSRAMKHLRDQGWIHQQSYGPVALSETGREKARKVYANHRLITAFLVKTLDLPQEEAEKNACRMEHVVTEAMLAAIEKLLKHKDET
jgi:Mn-dependent DtxR family transcriptional regulator